MAYDQPTSLPSGSTKLSEIAVDRVQPLIQSPVHATSIIVVEQMLKITADLLRKQNYFLRSVGKVNWNGAAIMLDDGGIANDMIFDLLQTDNAAQPKISLVMQGSTGVSTATTFNNLTLADGELLYLELDPAVIAAGGTSIIIENAVNGGSVVDGKTLKKTTLAAGIPTLTSPVDQSPNPTPASTTFYIPLCYRSGSTDIRWIPHGITWPAGTTSILGAIIVEGFQAIPERFVGSELQLLAALSDMTAQGGGVILVTQPFSITGTITLTANVKLMGRGKKSMITVNGGQIILAGENAEVQDLGLTCVSGYTGNMIWIQARRCRIRNVHFDLTLAPDMAASNSIRVEQSYNRVYECTFKGTAAAVNKTAINYIAGYVDNADVDSLFE